MQRHIEGLNDAAIKVLMGIPFIVILSTETFYGRFKIFLPRSAGGAGMILASTILAAASDSSFMDNIGPIAAAIAIAVLGGDPRRHADALRQPSANALTEKSGSRQPRPRRNPR